MIFEFLAGTAPDKKTGVIKESTIVTVNADNEKEALKKVKLIAKREWYFLRRVDATNVGKNTLEYLERLTKAAEKDNKKK